MAYAAGSPSVENAGGVLLLPIFEFGGLASPTCGLLRGGKLN